MPKIFAIIIPTLLFFSCGQIAEQERTTTPADNTVVDTVAILNDPKNNVSVQTHSFAEIDSSGIILFPLSMGESSRDGGSLSYKSIPYSSYWNIIFYNTHNSAYHLLSERKMLISSFDIKYSSDDNVDVTISKRNIFYRVVVDDYDQDKALTTEDPEYLFVSDKEGNNFRQISPAGYDLRSWQLIKSTNQIIMAVSKDSDKNRKFGDTDDVATFQIDIDKETQPREIFSTEFKNKLKILHEKDWKRNKE